MRVSRVLLVSITTLTVALGMPSVASAAPAGSPTHLGAPYTTTSTGGATDCRAGAVCTPQSTASATTGRINATMDMQRTLADEPAPESGFAYADQVVDLRVPKGATQLTATFSWSVRSANTSARADHGVIYASTALYANASCSGCSTQDAVEGLVSSSSTVPASDNANAVADVQKTLTITVDNLSGKGTVRLYTGASAHTDMNANRVCTGLPGCDLLPPVDPDHSGTAHAAVDATLAAVDVSYA
ncbi:MAG: hypothetical protein QOJ79_2200 [Actinomycetota bacterium]|jgi:hypothetical protein|nr:hypothetical protein [Actinomycetota bacterium]